MAEAPRVAGLRYTAIALLERRGGVVIWRALDALNGSPCVLVVLESSSAEALARFRERALALRELRHPVLVPLVDVGVEGGRAWAVREWVVAIEGAARVNLLGPLTPRQVVGVVSAVADALDALHQRGLTHGAVAPSRVLLTPEGTVRLVGAAVGAARETGPDSGPEDDLRAALSLLPALGGGALPAPLEALLAEVPPSALALRAALDAVIDRLPADPPDALPLGAQAGHDGATEDLQQLPPGRLRPSPPPKRGRRRFALAPLGLALGLAAWWWWRSA